jgi:primary-amine oxidase
MGHAVRQGISALAIVLAAALWRVPGAAAHPLDPLSSDEIMTAVGVLRDAGLVDAATRFPLIDLDEPDKSEVMGWKPGQPEFRKAFVVARRERTVHEGVVDLAGRKVERWQSIPNVQSSLLTEEWQDARRITIADPGWQAAMRKRGYNTLDQVFCAPLSAGPATDPGETGKRLLRVTCFGAMGSPSNLWGQPIEGLIAVVDLDAGKVVRLIDTGSVPINRQDPDFDEPSQQKRQARSEPVPNATQADHNFVVDAGELRWNHWSFRYRMDRRAGLIVSLMRFRDGPRDRMVLYRGSLAEMFVPYMDVAPAWAFRTFMDEGEWGLGLLSSPLAPGIDCPADALLLDAILPNDRGEPLLGKSVICVFERHAGAPAWRHFETASGAYQGQPDTELVLRTIPSVGNYDYIIDWVLTKAGIIRIEVGATGIDAVKGVRARTMNDLSATADTVSGTLVAPNLVGVNHDHFLSFRLDVDIEGASNTLVTRRLMPEGATGQNGHRGPWHAVDEAVTAEGPLDTSMHGAPEIWRVINPDVTNALGQNPGYEVRLEHSVMSLLPPDDAGQRRAAFSAAPLWVTAYDRSELYAAGPYPNQSRDDDGLPAYVALHRPVADADIVLWCTMGFHHLPRPEDWPGLPTMWHSMSLVPDGFFARNPALDELDNFSPNELGK